LRKLRSFLFVAVFGLVAIVAACADPAPEPRRLPEIISPPPVRPPPPPRYPYDDRGLAESGKLMGRQPAMLARAADALQPQRKNHVDLFALGFAGDGTQRVFRNEVEYFARLMATRFDAQGHTMSLVNVPTPDGSAPFPLATLSNLETALKQIGARMDPEEDILVLFLTSHGSREHELLVNQPPMPPVQGIRPRALRKALDQAGIRWRVLIVSACYSGGFVPALRDPHTLVITAARSDRSSFGCGSESRITWFGDAYLARALNETTDFQLAFTRAQALIRDWERKEKDTPSIPQLSAGSEIGPKLAAWRATAKAGPPLPFTGK
jgi:hypothetical protein